MWIAEFRRTNQVGDPSTGSTLAALNPLRRPPDAATSARTRGIGGPRHSLDRFGVPELIAGRNSAPLLVPYCKVLSRLLCDGEGRSRRTIDRSTIFPSCQQVLLRSSGDALARCFQYSIHLFEVETAVFPLTDLIGYPQRPDSGLMITEGRLRKFVRDANGLKGDQRRARTPTVVPASGMSTIGISHFSQLVADSVRRFLDLPVGRHRDRQVLAAPRPVTHAPQCG